MSTLVKMDLSIIRYLLIHLTYLVSFNPLTILFQTILSMLVVCVKLFEYFFAGIEKSIQGKNFGLEKSKV